jgi:hypothetical protein
VIARLRSGYLPRYTPTQQLLQGWWFVRRNFHTHFNQAVARLRLDVSNSYIFVTGTQREANAKPTRDCNPNGSQGEDDPNRSEANVKRVSSQMCVCNTCTRMHRIGSTQERSMQCDACGRTCRIDTAASFSQEKSGREMRPTTSFFFFFFSRLFLAPRSPSSHAGKQRNRVIYTASRHLVCSRLRHHPDFPIWISRLHQGYVDAAGVRASASTRMHPKKEAYASKEGGVQCLTLLVCVAVRPSALVRCSFTRVSRHSFVQIRAPPADDDDALFPRGPHRRRSSGRQGTNARAPLRTRSHCTPLRRHRHGHRHRTHSLACFSSFRALRVSPVPH